MSLRDISLGYGRGTLSARVDDAKLIAELQPLAAPALENPGAAALEALRSPMDGSAPLAARVRPGQRVTVLVSDVSRSWVDGPRFLPALVAELNREGVADRDITLLLATGTHRSHRPEEVPLVIGDDLVRRVRVLEHDCRDDANLVAVGRTSRGTPVRINRAAVESDLLLLTGGIVFHLMSGFGGGRKSVCPGVAAYDTVQANHCLLLDPAAEGRIGSTRLAGNPMHEDMMEIGALVAPGFLLNALPSADGPPGGFVAGNWDTAWLAGCRRLTEVFGRPLAARAELTIAGGGYPRDINLYQSTKALDNAVFATEPGGVIILVAACEDGAGAPEFFDWFRHRTLEEFEAALRRKFTVPGYVAYYLARACRERRVFLVSTLPEEAVRLVGAEPFRSLEDAVAEAYRRLGPHPSTVLLPHAPLTLPVLQDAPSTR